MILHQQTALFKQCLCTPSMQSQAKDLHAPSSSQCSSSGDEGSEEDSEEESTARIEYNPDVQWQLAWTSPVVRMFVFFKRTLVCVGQAESASVLIQGCIYEPLLILLKTHSVCQSPAQDALHQLKESVLMLFRLLGEEDSRQYQDALSCLQSSIASAQATFRDPLKMRAAAVVQEVGRKSGAECFK